MRISLAQINTTVGDIEGNRNLIIAALKRSRAERTELVVFPELTLTGYPPEDLLHRSDFIVDNQKALKALLPFTAGLAAVIGFVERDSGGRLFNASALISNKKIITVYRKNELPNYGVFDERRYFAAGSAPKPVRYKGKRILISICEDIWQKDSFVYSKNTPKKSDIFINISASPFHAGKQSERIALLRKVQKHVKAPVIYLNLVGGQDELVFDGGSLVMGRSGKILAEAARFEEQVLTVDLDSAKIPSRHAPLSREAEVYRALVLGTRDYIHKNRFKKVLIGLSGGIDSALVARIAVDALGADNVIGVTMPSGFTSSETYADAKRLAANLDIHCLEFPISAILKLYIAVIKKGAKSVPAGITQENLQARIRGNLLMALSNQYGHLVLTTGNKSEMATGYCTLYGDMAGGFAVIKDVPKTLVFKLACYANTLWPGQVIPKSIILRAPTAELRPHQKDRDTLPPYELLDKILEGYIEGDSPIDRIVKMGIPKALAYKVKRMVDRNEYKRRQAPPGVKITPKAFGRDRRMPITNRYKL